MSIFASSEVSFKPAHLDAAGALQVSQKTILGSYVIQGDDIPLLLDSKGTGTQTHSFGMINLSVAAGEYLVNQSKIRHPYFPGKSQRIEKTFDSLTHDANVVKQEGYFSSSTVAPYSANEDGFWLESDGTDYKIVIANDGTKTEILQSNWGDPLDGTGPSGKTIDFAKFTIMIFDFLYLGGSSLRVFFKIDGVNVLAHQYDHSNEQTGTIIKSPSQPVRSVIRSTTGTGSFNKICSTVSTEGSLNFVGLNRSSDMSDDKINANSTSNTYLLKAIRLKSTNLYATVLDFAYSFMSTTADNSLVKVILNPNIAGSPAWVAESNSSVEIATGDISGNPSATTITGGTLLSSKYLVEESQGDLKLNSELRLGSDIDGTQTVIALCVQPQTTNLDISASINWLEI